MKINPVRVNEIFKDCLFKNEEVINNKTVETPVIANGIVINVGFHPGRLKDNTEEIYDIIDNLHGMFYEGWTFLNFCLDKDENQWTGSHRTMEELMLLGLATNKLKYTCERELWSKLPGSMPYLFNIKREDIKE